MHAHARPGPGRADERRVALSLTDSRGQDARPVTYLARMSARATSIDRSFDPERTDAEVSATTEDGKACVIGGVPLERLPNLRVSGNDDAVRELLDATSPSGPSGTSSDAKA